MLATDQAIRQRQTEKVLSETNLECRDYRSLVDELIALAGLAPFHRVCDEVHRSQAGLNGIEPWRFHALDATNCRRLRERIPTQNAGKIPAMLAAADALILATWLPHDARPQTAETEADFSASLINMEHIAATAAAIENLLLAASSRGIANYWSSGGVLRLPEVMQLLGITCNQILLGAIFLFPQAPATAEHVTSKLRSQRTPPAQWSRWASLE